MKWWESARAASVASVAKALNYEFRGSSFGPVCPACQSARRSGSDRRMALTVVAGGAQWRHYDSSCADGWGDCVDLVAYAIHRTRLSGLRPEERDDVQAWFASAGYCEPPQSISSSPRRIPRPVKVELAPVDDAPSYPPAMEVVTMWSKAKRLDWLWSHEAYGYSPGGGLSDESDAVGECGVHDVAYRYIESRGYDIDTLTEHDLARLLPIDYPWPGWWPWGADGVWRLAVLAFDATGTPRSIHARATQPEAERKTRWPLRYDARGLLFACPLAHRLLQGEKRRVDAIVVCEGLTDWLAAAQSACALDKNYAVFGAASGGFRALGDVDLPRAPVLVMTDRDEHGDRYAETVRRSLPNHRVVRV